MGYCPHPGQLRFHLSKARFRAVAPGRRWGKTYCGANEVIRYASQSPCNSIGFVIAPSYSSTSLGKCWKTVLQFAPRRLIRNIHRTPGNMYIEWLQGHRTLFRSAESPDSCKGESVVYAWFDEPASMQPVIWEEAVLPSLIDTDGAAWFTGTPKGSNWYRFLFLKGQDPEYADYWSYGGSSYDNTVENGGYLKRESIDAIACEMPEHVRLQEIYGVFLDDMGVVFRNVQERVVKGKGYMERVPTRKYVVGVDFAKHEDYTVCVVLDSTGEVVFIDRFGEVDWILQQKRVVELSRRYGNARILVDSTGVGDPVYDGLVRMGAPVQGYKFTNASKADLIENLSLVMERGEVTFPDTPESKVMVNELQVYGYKKTPAGLTVYGAPEGCHDDTVIALGLAVWQNSRPRGFWA